MIIPCYNVAATAERLVTALLQQDLEAELIFVDDGSSDGTAEHLTALTADSDSARVLVHETNRGRAAARNIGVAAATGTVLLFLDADMEPEPDFVRVHAEAHRRSGVIGIISTPVLEGLDPDDPYHQYLATKRGAASLDPDEPVPFRYFIIGYTSVKADAVRAVGGFDERFTYGEDIDFAYRLSQHYPGRLFLSKQAIVHHHNHGTLDDRLDKLRVFGRDNLPLLLAKHPEMAEAANLDFVGTTRTLKGHLKRWALQPALGRWLYRNVQRIPHALRFVGLRYLMASVVATAYRDTR